MTISFAVQQLQPPFDHAAPLNSSNPVAVAVDESKADWQTVWHFTKSEAKFEKNDWIYYGSQKPFLANVNCDTIGCNSGLMNTSIYEQFILKELSMGYIAFILSENQCSFDSGSAS